MSKPWLPATTDAGDVLVIVGACAWLIWFIVKVAGLELVLPFITLTAHDPANWMSDAKIETVIWLKLLFDRIVLVTLQNLTTELDVKPVPLTVIVKPGSPAVADDGVMLLIAGGGVFIIKVEEALETEVTTLPFVTVTAQFLTIAISDAKMEAVNWVAEIYVVVLDEPQNWTKELGVKLVPLTVRVKSGPPAVADDGLILVTVGVITHVGLAKVLLHAATKV